MAMARRAAKAAMYAFAADSGDKLREERVTALIQERKRRRELEERGVAPVAKPASIDRLAAASTPCAAGSVFDTYSGSSSSSGSGSNSSSDSESSSDDERHRKRKKKEKKKKSEKKKGEKKKKEKKKRKKEEKKKKVKQARRRTDKEEKRRAEEGEHASLPVPSVPEALPVPSVPEAPPADEMGQQHADSRRMLGAQRPEDAAEERESLQQIHRVLDPSLGVYRTVRASGEVIETSVSRQEQQRLMGAKARAVPTAPTAPTAAQSFTGKDKFPSQHPWHGYK